MALQNAVFEIVGDLRPSEWGKFGVMGTASKSSFVSPITNFYMTDPISRASATMAACSKNSDESHSENTGTHG